METQVAVDTWRELCKAHADRAGYWRRLGIVQFTFHRPDGADAFQQAVSLDRAAQNPVVPQKLPILRSGLEGGTADFKPPLTADQENALWQALYGTQTLSGAQVTTYRAQLVKLKLGWFENLAVEQLYTRARQPALASQAHAAALASANTVIALGSLRIGSLLLGLLGLLILCIRRPTLPHPSASVLMPAEKPGPITRKIAFVAYLLTMTFVALPLRPLRYLITTWSAEAVARFSTILNLVIYIPVVLIPLWVLYTSTYRREPRASTEKAMSWRALLAQIGFRTRGVPGDLGTGMVGYLLITPLFLLAAVLSSHLFRHFQTPVNPVETVMMTLSTPFDKILLFVETAIAAPLVEETMFRGLLYPALRAQLGVPGAVALSAAFFAIVHPTLPGEFLPIWTLGIALALVYEWRQSLLPGIILHGINNGLVLATVLSIFAS